MAWSIVAQQIKTFAPDHGFVPENGSDFFTDAVQARWLSIVPSMFTPDDACSNRY